MIYISLSSQSVSPGDVLKGDVHIDLTQTYPASSLMLEFVGLEECDESDSESNFETFELMDLHTSVLFKYDSDGVQPGQYTIPFQILVPDRLPSTVWLTRGDLQIATFRYQLKATLTLPQGINEDSFFCEHGVSMRVAPPPPQLHISEEVTEKVTSWMGMVDHGEVNLKVKLLQDWF